MRTTAKRAGLRQARDAALRRARRTDSDRADLALRAVRAAGEREEMARRAAEAEAAADALRQELHLARQLALRQEELPSLPDFITDPPQTAGAAGGPAAPPPPERALAWEETWSFELPARTPQGRRCRAPRRRVSDRAHLRSDRRPRPEGERSAIAAARSWVRLTGLSKAASVVILLICAAGAWAAAPTPRHITPSTADAASSRSRFPRSASDYARRDIPSAYIRLYVRAARQYHLGWPTLAAVGQIESNHGRSRFPGVTGGTNRAGAAGPAQFLARTWARYGVDGNNDGTISPYDPADAIPAMASYLRASGAPADWRGALFTYNHSWAYVASVIALRRRYRASAG